MPLLDVSDIILDPLFADKFNVLRRKQVVNDSGILSTQNTTIINKIGCFTVAGPTDLERLDDNERMNQNFCLVTKFHLFGPTKDIDGSDYLPDKVIWNNNEYIVKDVGPYTRYGAGFVQAIICSDVAIEGPDA